MVVTRALKTVDVGLVGDTWLNEEFRDTNYGLGTSFSIGAGQTAWGPRRVALLNTQMPNAPSDADTSRPNGGITKLELVIYRQGVMDNYMLLVSEVVRDFSEDEATFNNLRPSPANLITIIFGASIGSLAIPGGAAQGYKFVDISAAVTSVGALWGDRVPVAVWAPATTDSFDLFTSKESSEAGKRPYLRITYEATPMEPVDDLKVDAATDDPELTSCAYPRLTWAPPRDPDGLFSKYEVWRKDGAAAFAKRAEITQLGANDWVDDGADQGFGASAVPENAVIQYDLRVTDTNGSTISSNIVWLIRPDIQSVTDLVPFTTVGVAGTFRITPAAYVSTPTPVANEDYFVRWGEGTENDISTTRFKSDVSPADREHVYPYAGTAQTRRARIRNDLGFWSDLTGPVQSTPTASAPTAKITAGPTSALEGATIYLSGEESYPGAGNQTFIQYAWDFDWDGVQGNFVADETSVAPTTTRVYPTAGTFRVGLRVRQSDGQYSIVVGFLLDIAADVVVDLDALVDGWSAIFPRLSRGGADMEGPMATKMASTGKRLIRCRLEGKAFSNLDANIIPADWTTLLDIRENNKRVKTARITGTAKNGVMRDIDGKQTSPGVFEWTASLTLEA